MLRANAVVGHKNGPSGKLGTIRNRPTVPWGQLLLSQIFLAWKYFAPMCHPHHLHVRNGAKSCGGRSSLITSSAAVQAAGLLLPWK